MSRPIRREIPPQAQLLAFIEGLGVELNTDLKEDTPLLTSGLFDSLALFRLVQWIEQEVGAPLDPTTFDIVEEWNTVTDILAFIRQHRSA